MSRGGGNAVKASAHFLRQLKKRIARLGSMEGGQGEEIGATGH